MERAFSKPVWRNDIFVSQVRIPLASGFTLPAGTAFVCRKGGLACELVFQHPGHGGLSMVSMTSHRVGIEMVRGLRHHLPMRLASAFGYPVDHIRAVRPVSGRRYQLRAPVLSLDGATLPVGTMLDYCFINGLHVFTILGKSRNGYPARLVLGEEELRAIEPVAKGSSKEPALEVA